MSLLFRFYSFLIVLAALLLNSVAFSAAAFEQTLNIPSARSSFDISHNYHKILLLKALQAANKNSNVSLVEATVTMSQGRAIEELKKSTLDVYWLGTSQQLEADLLPIKIPTTRGLIGFRKFIIHKDSLEKFNRVNTISDLKGLSACQGTHWPDTQILRAANLSVVTTPIYEDLFKMVNAKRCDYFPRGYHDVKTELNLRKGLYPNLISYDNILLQYPFAVYFFTNNKNTALAKDIEKGLRLMAENSEIEQLMTQHPLTSSIYPLHSEEHTVVIKLSNPLLPQVNNFSNKDYWILPSDFSSQ